jgi:hypothetical protein
MAEKLFKYEIGSEVIVNENAKKFMPSYVGRTGVIEDTLTTGSYDYEVGFDKSTTGRFKEIELDLPDALPLIDFPKESDSVEDFKFKVGETVLTRTNDNCNGWEVEIIKTFRDDFGIKEYKVKHGESEYFFEEKELVEIATLDTPQPVQGRFTEIALEIGQFTDMKNKQYGSSVDATYEMIKVLMERYRNSENTYEIPESLLQHLLLTVRVMDKQNRIFNNPSGEGDSESPWRDITGYGLIGIDMVNKK